jgi:hypothetical protein
MQQNRRIYVMAAPCGGKSTFAAKGIYRQIRLVDFNVHFDHWAQASNFNLIEFSRVPLEERERLYNEVNITYLYDQADPVCILGVVGPDDPHAYANIAFVIVQPPLLRAMTNCLRRKLELRKSNQTSIWSKWSNIRDYRRKLRSYAKLNGIPMYPSFENALDAALDHRP